MRERLNEALTPLGYQVTSAEIYRRASDKSTGWAVTFYDLHSVLSTERLRCPEQGHYSDKTFEKLVEFVMRHQ